MTDAPKAAKAAPSGPKTIDMVRVAITAQADRKGASVPAIKNYIVANYPSVDPTKLKFRLRKALEKGFESGLFKRPKNSEYTGPSLNGRFLLNKDHVAAEAKAKKAKAKAADKAAKEPKKPKSTPTKSTTTVAKTKVKKSPSAKAKAKAKAKASPKKKVVKTGPTKDKLKQPKAKAAATKALKTPKKSAKTAKTAKTPKTKASKK